MLKKFKITALTKRHGRGGKTISVFANYVIEARNPFDAWNKLCAKYPGRHPSIIAECWPNGTAKAGKTFTPTYLNEHREEVMVSYDFES